MIASTTPVAELTTILATARHLGLNLSSVQLLLLLSKHAEMNMSTAAEEIGISCQSLTGVAKKLIAKGLITRAHSGHLDMRIVHLRLTEMGRARVFQLTGQQD